MNTSHITDDDLEALWLNVRGGDGPKIGNIRKEIERLPSPPPSPARLLPIIPKGATLPDVAEGFVRVTGFNRGRGWEISTEQDDRDTHYCIIALPVDDADPAFEKWWRELDDAAQGGVNKAWALGVWKAARKERA